MGKNKEQLVAEFIDAQVEKWRSRKKSDLPVITFSVSPGSGGHIIARRVAELLKFDFFDREIVKIIAEYAHISDRVINTAKSDNDAAIGAIIGAISGGKKLIEKNCLQ